MRPKLLFLFPECWDRSALRGATPLRDEFEVLSEGFEIETEMSVHALELRMPVGEVETSYAARPEGSQSKLSTFSDGWRILKTIGTVMVFVVSPSAKVTVVCPRALLALNTSWR